MKRQIRIFKLWYYGKIKLAKAARRRIIFEYWFWRYNEDRKFLKEMKQPKYQYWDNKSFEAKESDTPIPTTTIAITKENYNQ